MIKLDPSQAPKRADLTYLRRRSRVANPAPNGPRAAAATAAVQGEPVRAAVTSLDLSAPSARVGQVHEAPARLAPVARLPTVPRTAPTGRTVLTPTAPVVTLSRLQTGVGTLIVRTAVPASLSALRLGCAYELTSGETSIVQAATGRRFGPAAALRPVLIGARQAESEQLSVDLRQCGRVRRLVIYGFSQTPEPIGWAGSLLLSLFGGSRIELGLQRPPLTGVGVLLSIYEVDGEFVVRAEMEIIAGSVRDACTAYGFTGINWLDGVTPVD